MELFAERAPWWIAGPLIGLCVVGLLWAANLPLGATGAFVGLWTWIKKPSEGPSWRVFSLVGMIGGGLVFALLSGGPDPTFAYGSFDATLGSSLAQKAAVLVGAGALIGYGARTAAGCTSGHGICGNSLGSPASFVATATFMATAVLATNVAVRLLGGAS